MEEHDEELATCLAGMRSLVPLIQAHDRDLWQVGDPPFAKLRHVHTHLSKVTGKLATLVEPLDHRADAEGPDVFDPSDWADDLAPIVSDLLIHAAQLAELSGLNPADALVQRWERNAARFAPASDFARRVGIE